MGEHRPSSSRKRSARVIQLICAYQSICDGLFCIFGISWLTSRKTIKMRFYFYWPEPFYVSSSDIHTYSFSFCFSLSLSSQFNSVRFSLVLCCMLVVFVLFRFVFFLFQIWGYTQVFNEKFHRLFSSWNVQIVDAWWLIRNCAASDKKSRTAGSGAFAVLILTHLFDIYVLAKRLRSQDRLGYELEVMNHIVE